LYTLFYFFEILCQSTILIRDGSKLVGQLTRARGLVGYDVALTRFSETPAGSENLSQISLVYTDKELDLFIQTRINGLSPKSQYWIKRACHEFWKLTQGEISWNSLTNFRDYVVNRWTSSDAHRKVLGLVNSFLKYLAKIRMDIRYSNFGLCLELSRSVKERKMITQRIVTIEDISSILAHIKKSHDEGLIDKYRYQQYVAIVLFGSYTGQRSMATISKLTVGQFNCALMSEKPVLLVKSSQDKIRMEHYVPIHPNLVDLLSYLSEGKSENNSFWMWNKRQQIPMSHNGNHFVLGDLRKFAEQYGDIIGWEQSNRAYILTHGVSGIDWKHYKHPMPDHVYDNYMKYWQNVNLKIRDPNFISE